LNKLNNVINLLPSVKNKLTNLSQMKLQRQRRPRKRPRIELRVNWRRLSKKDQSNWLQPKKRR